MVFATLAMLGAACSASQGAVVIASSTLPVQLKWQQSSGAQEVGPLRGIPGYADDRVYFWSGSKLLALDVKTGEKIWEYDAKGFIWEAQASDRFVVFLVRTGWIEDTLVVLDTEGEMIWKQSGYFRSFCLGDSLLFAALEGHVRAYDLATGETIWDNQEAAESHWNTHLLYENSSLYVEGRNLRVLNPITGEMSREFEAQTVPGQTGIYNSILYTTDYDNNMLIAIDGQTGAMRWSRTYWPARDDFNAFALVDGVLYIPDREGNVLAVDSDDGTLLWQYQGSPRVQVLSNVVVFGDTVYAVFSDDTLRGIDTRTGQEIGRLKAAGVDPPTEGGPIGIAKIATADSLLLVTFDGVTLFALQPQ